MGTRLLVPLVIVMAVVAIGCKKAPIPTPEPDANPRAFDASKDTWATFIEGKWCPTGGVNPAAAEEYGLDPNADLDVSQWWVFRQDGTFSYGKLGSKNEITGTWMPSSDGVSLIYEKWGAETISDRQTRLAKAEEGGTQAAIAEKMLHDNQMSYLSGMDYMEITEDSKGLVFTTMGGGGGGGSVLNMTMDTELKRMK